MSYEFSVTYMQSQLLQEKGEMCFGVIQMDGILVVRV